MGVSATDMTGMARQALGLAAAPTGVGARTLRLPGCLSRARGGQGADEPGHGIAMAELSVDTRISADGAELSIPGGDITGWPAKHALRALIVSAGLQEKRAKPSRISSLTNRKTGNSPSGPKSPAFSESAKAGAQGSVKVAESASREGGNTRAWVAAGAVAVVIVLGGGAFAVVRTRRR